MNWSKPSFEDLRFGFEITMYVYQKSKPTKIGSESYHEKSSQQLTSRRRNSSAVKS